MTAIGDFCTLIREWLNIGSEVYPDSVVTSWVRMTEETLSKRLRCKEMIEIAVGTIINQRYALPGDWREMDLVRVIGGGPLRYIPRDDFYNPDEPFVSDLPNCYTIIGNYIAIGANAEDGAQIEIAYYQDVPTLGDDPTWLSSKFPTLNTVTTLHVATMYAIEDERGPMWESKSDGLIADINSEHSKSKASGSRLTLRHRRSFG